MAAASEDRPTGQIVQPNGQDQQVIRAIAAYEDPKQAQALQKANQLVDLIIQEPHRFALHGDAQLVSAGLDALKALFDFSIETEGPAIPPIADTLRSTFPDDDAMGATASRSSGKRKRKGGPTVGTQAHRLFEPTPLSELTTEGMTYAQLWDQLEWRNRKLTTLLDAVIVTEQAQDDDIERDDDESEEEEDEEALDEVEKKGKKRRSMALEEGGTDEEVIHSLNELSDAELRALGLDPAQRAEIEAMGGSDEEEEEEDDEDDEDGQGYPGASDLSDDDEYSGIIVTEPLLSEEEQQKRKAEAEAQERRQLRSQRKLAKMMQHLHGEEDEDADEDEDEDEDEEYGESSEEEEEGSEEEEETTDGGAGRLSKSILDDLDGPGSNTANDSNSNSARLHPELDDQFFSIDQFNRDTDDYGDDGVKLGEEVDLFKSMDREEEKEQEEPLFYADFFAPPPNKQKGTPKTVRAVQLPVPTEKTLKRVPSVRFNDEVSVRRIKARRDKDMQITPELLQLLQQQQTAGDSTLDGEEDGDGDVDDDEDDEDEEDSDDEEEDYMQSDGEEDDSDEGTESEGERNDISEGSNPMGADVDASDQDKMNGRVENGSVRDVEMDDVSESDGDQEIAGRVAGDLFADEQSADEDERSGQSSHQRRLAALQQEIARLEQENVTPKDWTLMGEAASRARPENSLLEEDLEFENNRKAKPVNTPESTQSIEDMIKKRILDSHFDDVQRRATLQPLDFIPSKMLELSDAKNPKSLDQVYEDELGGVADTQGAKLDKELQKEHDEIDGLYSRLEAQLDSLSNAHYTPKAPKVAIRTLSDAPTIELEESLPSTMNHGSQLAPEEVYSAGAHSAALQGASTELTPEEKRKRHRQLRDEKRARNERIAEHRRNVEIHREAFGQHRGGRFAGAPAGASNQGGKRAALEKEEALRKLMGNKGVSVVGKGAQADGKSSQRGGRRANDGGRQPANAANLKL